MIDNRIDNKSKGEIDSSLTNITDTDIMLNFQEALSKLYPHLIPISAYCYDSWDNIIESLYDEMILNAFCWKYGVYFDKDKFHRYAFHCEDFNKLHHIECFIIRETIKMQPIHKEWDTYPKSYFLNKKIIFKEFSDGINNLTGSISKEEAKHVGFQLANAFLVNQLDGEYDEVFFDTCDLTFELVLENV